MFPSQTSLIPITVALAKFTAANGFGGLYPYWYLGSTPVKYLTGPVVPGVLVGLHQLLPNFSLFDLSYFVILTSYFISAIGWGILSGRLSGSRMVGWWVGGLTFILPWHWVSGFGLGEVSAVAASALTPWVLIAFVARSLAPIKKRSTNLNSKFETIYPSCSGLRQHHTLEESWWRFASWLRHVFDWGQASVLPLLALALLLLTNTTAAIPAIVGLLILAISDRPRFLTESKYQISNIKRAALVILAAWVLSTFWYGVDYWQTIFGAPSIGGKSVVGAFVTLLNFLRGFVPVILAVVLVFWGVKPKSLYDKFVLAWLMIFGSLTLFRFMADPAFWMDWTAWMGEVEIGVALLLGHFLARSSNASVLRFDVRPTSDTLAESDSARLGLTCSKGSSPRNESNGGVYRASLSYSIYYLLFTIYILGTWLIAWQNRDFWLPRADTSQSVEYKIATWLNQDVNCQLSIVNCQIVFLSGTTAFWLNSLVDVRLVRGGREGDTANGDGRESAWEIREGATGEGTERALRTLNISYVVVHTKDSGEFYHDFLYPQKFENISSLTKIYEKDGDVIYQVGD